MVARLLAFTFCAALCNLPTAAQQPQPPKEQPPAAAPASSFHLAQRTHYVLSNGIQVNLLQFGSVPKVTILIEEAAGKVNEDPQHVDLSAITAELMAEGTSTHSGEEVARLAGDMGSQLSIHADTYQSEFSMDVLNQNAADAIALLADVIQHPAFPEKDLERLRADHLRSRATSLANPAFLARQKFAQVMYGDQPLWPVAPD